MEKKKSLLALIATVALAAHAAEVSWTGEGGNSLWTNPDNWSGDAVPGEDDVIKPVANVNITVDLGNSSRTIKQFDFSDAFSWPSSGRYAPTIELRNGELSATDGWIDNGDYVNDVDNGFMTENHTRRFDLINATLKIQSTFKSGRGRMLGHCYRVNDNSRLILDHVNLFDRFTYIDVQPGGLVEMSFNKTIQKDGNSTCRSTWMNNGGTFKLPDGFTLNRTATAGWSKRASFRIQQNAGTMELGGNIALGNAKGAVEGSAIGLFFQWAGGTVHATGNVFFDVDAVFAYPKEDSPNRNESYIAANAEVIADVDEEKTLDISGLPMRDGVVMTKNGLGALQIGEKSPVSMTVNAGQVDFVSDVPQAMTINGGLVKIQDGTTLQDASWLTFGDGGVLNIDTVSEINVAPHGTPVFQFTDGSKLLPESVIFSSPIPVVLEAAANAIRDSGLLPEGLGLSTKNGQILLSSDYSFESSEITDLSDQAGWSCGMVPVGKDVLVKGEAVSVVLNTSTPAFSSISLADGATITVSENMTIPTIALVNNAKLVIPNGVEAVLGGFTATTTDLILPELVVESGATLNVVGETKFSNLRLTLAGSIVTTSAGGVTFGFAPVGEITYFAMNVDGGTITLVNPSGNEGASPIRIVAPEDGGQVVVLDPISLKNTQINLHANDGFVIGLNNPAMEAFQIIADNCNLTYGAESYVAGGANLILKNNSLLLRGRHGSGNTDGIKFNLVIANRGRITVQDGAEIRAGKTVVNNNTTDGVIRFSPDAAGYYGIDVLEGGIACWYKADGLNRGAIRFDGGIFDCCKSHWWGWGNRSHMFNNLFAVEIAADSQMVFRGVPVKLSDDDNPLEKFELEAPFTGEGDLLITNTRGNTTMEPSFMKMSDCLGKIEAQNGANNAKVKVHFADKSGWAGKVVANGLVDLGGSSGSDLAGPAEVSFGAVDLTGEFPIRIYGTYDEETKTATITGNDKVNITGAGWLNNGGQIAVQFPETFSADTLPVNVRIPLGTMPADAALPKVRRADHLVVYTQAIEGDTAHLIYGLKPNRGFAISFR